MNDRLREIAEQHPTYTREIAAWVDRYCAGDTIPGILRAPLGPGRRSAT